MSIFHDFLGYNQIEYVGSIKALTFNLNLKILSLMGNPFSLQKYIN